MYVHTMNRKESIPSFWFVKCIFLNIICDQRPWTVMLHSLHNLLTSFKSTRYVVASFLVGKINAVDQSRQGLDHGKRGGGRSSVEWISLSFWQLVSLIVNVLCIFRLSSQFLFRKQVRGRSRNIYIFFNYNAIISKRF